jgi:glycosyltransferase involved in cell wall biosynthesis
MKALVSILIPAYNAERWISDTIESALAQTWPHKEIVIVDDGSSDGTLAIARRYQGKHVRVLHQHNQGSAATRNTAYRHCQGEYVQWLDADDLLSPYKVMNQIRLIQDCTDPRILISSPWAHFMYRRAAAKFSQTLLWEDLEPIEWMLRKWTFNLHMQTATWLVSRELAEAAGPWNTELLGDDDGEYFARVVLASTGIRFAREANVYYRIVGTNRLSYIGRSNMKLDAQLRSMKLQIDYVRAIEDTPRVHAAIVRYLQIWLPHVYPERQDLVAQMKALAAAVGGKLHTPGIDWKYSIIDKVLGRAAAKRAQLHYNQAKMSLLRSCDRTLYALAGR